jgi:hypothetical protein
LLKKAAPPTPIPRKDWICQRQLADILGISEHTASVRAKAGKLRRFEHGIPDCGRRIYSRTLVQRELEERWETAVRNQDAALGLVNIGGVIEDLAKTSSYQSKTDGFFGPGPGRKKC